MSKNEMPIFKLPTITHINTKARKEFILDCLFIGVGVSILYVALNEEFSEGVISLHKNKHRKNIKHIRDIYHELKDKQTLLYSMMSLEDRRTVAHKNESIVANKFILNIAKSEKDLCLEYVAVSILKQGLTRRRRFPIYDYLKPFRSFLTHAKIVKEIKGAIEHDYKNEWEVAEKFVSEIRY